MAQIEHTKVRLDEAQGLRQQVASELKVLADQLASRLFPRPTHGVLGDSVRFQTGYAFKSEWFSDLGVRLARNANVGHGTLDWTDIVRLPEERRAEFARFDLDVGDILVALDRPIISTGVKVARLRAEDLPCLLLQRVARAQFRSDALWADYLFCWLRSPFFIGAIDPGRSNGVPHISHKDLERIPFAVPSLSEQRRIVTEAVALQARIDALQHLQAETAAELDALLPAVLDRAFAGAL